MTEKDNERNTYSIALFHELMVNVDNPEQLPGNV